MFSRVKSRIGRIFRAWAKEWQEKKDSPGYFDNCSADIRYARQAMILSQTPEYKIIKGWFSETLPRFKPDEPIAILRLDGDWYKSTMECLENLYQYVAPGGIIIIDDYYVWDGCTKAVHNFLSKNQITDRIFSTEHNVCYIVKQK